MAAIVFSDRGQVQLLQSLGLRALGAWRQMREGEWWVLCVVVGGEGGSCSCCRAWGCAHWGHGTRCARVSCTCVCVGGGMPNMQHVALVCFTKYAHATPH